MNKNSPLNQRYICSIGGDGTQVVELQLETGLSDEFLNERFKVAQDPSFRNHVIAEINLARFIRGITFDLQTKAVNLTSRLKEYQAEIE
jgi:hypothetical protein